MISSVAESYFDWEQQFKKKKERLTKLGISEEEYKKFMKEWKEKNLQKENNKKEHENLNGSNK